MSIIIGDNKCLICSKLIDVLKRPYPRTADRFEMRRSLRSKVLRCKEGGQIKLDKGIY